MAFVAQLLPVVARPVAAATVIEPGFQLTTIFSGVNQPTAIGFGGDGRIFVAERDGLIKAWDGPTDPTPTTVVDLGPQVHSVGDRGLLGMAVDPQFPSRPYLYALYIVDAQPGGPAPFYNDNCPLSPSGAKDGCPAAGRLSRIQVDGASHIVGNEFPLLAGTFWCQQQQGHAVDHLEFGPDGALYASSGDGSTASFTDWGQHSGAADAVVIPNACGDPPVPAGTPLSLPTTEGGALHAQDLRTSGDPAQGSGAIIRVDPDNGGALPDNPLVGNGIASDDRHIAFGLRNPFRFTFRPGTDEIWVGDVGWNNWEEIDRIVSPTDATVENFGWPCYEGVGRQTAFDNLNVNLCEDLYAAGAGAVTAPYWTYRHDAPPDPTRCSNNGGALSGLAFAGAPYPAQYHGGLFVGDYVKGCVWMLMPGGNGLPDPANVRTILTGSFPTDMAIGPEGKLWIADIVNGTVSRLDSFGGNAPPVARLTATPPYGPAPLGVTFDASTTSDDGPLAALIYEWDLDGDGAYDDATGVTAAQTYASSVNVTVGLRVTDGAAATGLASTIIRPGDTPPRGTIVNPLAGTTWASGDTIAFDGTVEDDEEALGASSMRWTVGLFHCVNQTDCHEHPQGTWNGVTGGSYPAPEHEYPAYLEVRLTVTDSRGLATTTTRRLDPRTVQVQFQTVPSGLTLGVGDTVVTTPATVTAIEGSRISITGISPQFIGPTSYLFQSWSDGGAVSHDVVPATSGATYTATYAAGGPGSVLLVVGDPAALSTGDVAVRDRLQARGYTVVVVDDAASVAGDATGKRAVLVSSTVSAGNVGTKFRSTSVPVINWEHALYDDFGMTAAAGTQVSGNTGLTISNPGHPLAAGLSGTVSVASAVTNFAIGTPNGAATVIATIPSTTTPAIFAYESSAAMPGLSAPARRVGFFLGEVTAASFTANGTALFDAALDWAVGAGGPSPTPTPSPTATPSPSPTASPTPTATPTPTPTPSPTPSPTATPSPTPTPTPSPSPTPTPSPTPSPTPTPTPPPGSGTVLFVVGDPALGTGDAAIRTRLQALGYTVSVVDDAVTVPGDATGKRLVLISSTVTAGNVVTKFRTTTVPVVIWEHALYDEMGMTAVGGSQVGGQRTLSIVAPAHPLAAGLSGTVTIATSPQGLATGIPNGNATVVATIAGQTTPTIFAYDAGAAMPGLAAPARRVGLYLAEKTAADFTPAGRALFDAAVTWAVAIPGGQAATTTTAREDGFLGDSPDQRLAGLEPMARDVRRDPPIRRWAAGSRTRRATTDG